MTAKLFSLEYGLGGVCVLLTLLVLMKVAEFLWKLHEKKEALSEETTKMLIKTVQDNTVAVQLLEHRMRSLETSFSELPKLKLDIRRSFTAIKTLSGDRWPVIRDELMKDRFTQ